MAKSRLKTEDNVGYIKLENGLDYIIIMAGITSMDVATVLFNGQADIVLFDEVTDYTKATFASLTAKGQSLGQIVEDSTTWEGDDPSTDAINDEQGDVITTTVSAGSYAFSCDVASTSSAVIETFMKGKKLSGSLTSTTITGVSDVLKFGTELPVITRPIAIFNDEANRWLLFPKAKIVANLTEDSKLWRVHITATAEYLDLPDLGTCMIGAGSPSYETE